MTPNYNYPGVSNDTFHKLLTEGTKVEEQFNQIITDLGYTSRLSTKKENMSNHVDVYFKHNDKEYGVDVKGMKRLSRHDKEASSEYHYLELKNVFGQPGWLYGKAHYIAFEHNDEFILVSTVRLRNWVTANVRNVYVNRGNDAYKYKYTRNNSDDIITLIKTEDLLQMANKIIKK